MQCINDACTAAMELSEVHHSMNRYSKDVCHINRLFNLVYVTYNLVHHAQST